MVLRLLQTPVKKKQVSQDNPYIEGGDGSGAASLRSAPGNKEKEDAEEQQRAARGWMMAREFDVNVRAGVIELEDVDEYDEGSKRIMEHIGKLLVIQGPHIRGTLNKMPEKPIGPWPPTPSAPIDLEAIDANAPTAQPPLRRHLS